MKPWGKGIALDWNDVRLIAEIGRTGSFTAAAAALGVSKPTVSRRVAYLEQTARAKIFRRGPHGATLTAVGEQLVRRAGPIEDSVLDFERFLRASGQSVRRVISAQMTEGVASYLITPAMTGQRVGPLGAAVHATGLKLPDLKLVQPNAGDRADIELVWTPTSELPKAKPTDKTRKLAEVRFVPLFSGNYAKNRKAPDSFAELGRQRLITMHAYRWFSNDGWAEWHNLADDARSDTIAVDWSSALGFLIRSGAGIGLLPTYAPMYSDGLLPLEVKSPLMMGTLWIVCSDDSYADRTVSDCFATLGKLFAAADWMNAP